MSLPLDSIAAHVTPQVQTGERPARPAQDGERRPGRRPSRQLAAHRAEAAVLLPPDWTLSVSELARQRHPEEFLRTGWFRVPVGHTTYLYGDGGIGKSSFVYQFALAVGTGHQFMGGSDHAQRVLVLDAEASAPEIAFRLSAAARHLGVPTELVDRNVKIVSLKSHGKTAFDMEDALQAVVSGFDPTLIVIDSYNSAFGGDPTSSEHVNSVNRLLNRLTADHRAALVLHHISSTQVKAKVPMMGGLRTIRNYARLVYRMGQEAKGGVHDIEVEKVNPRWDGPKKWTVRRVEAGDALLFEPVLIVNLGEDAPRKQWVFAEVADGSAVLHVLQQQGELRMTALHRALAELTNRGESTVREALLNHGTLAALEADGRIARRKDPNDGRAWLITLGASR